MQVLKALNGVVDHQLLKLIPANLAGSNLGGSNLGGSNGSQQTGRQQSNVSDGQLADRQPICKRRDRCTGARSVAFPECW